MTGGKSSKAYWLIMTISFKGSAVDADLTKETIEDLQYQGLKIIQNKSCFCFGMDAVLLADFITLRRGDKVLDLCTGSGIIPILLSGQQTASHITGIELMAYIADMGKRSITLNGISDQVSIIEGDIKDAHRLAGGVFDVVSVNPPYEKGDNERQSDNLFLAGARHELFCTLQDVCKSAGRTLKSGGKFFMIHRVARLEEIFNAMRAHRIAPKRLRFIHPAMGTEPNLVLIEGAKNGKSGIRVMPPLFVRDENGVYTKEINRIYHIEEAVR